MSNDKLYFWIGLSPLILGLIITAVTIALMRFLPPRLPLFYSMPWGEGQLATRQQFLIAPATIGLVTLLNLAISWQLHESQSFFKKILLISSLIISLIIAITFIRIVLLFI